MNKVRKLVSKKELKLVYGIPYCFAHIARLEAAGSFPSRVRLGACRVALWPPQPQPLSFVYTQDREPSRHPVIKGELL